ncbi:MAG: HD domain-containing protein [Ruminococcaceae bacterium]|nr:HD domain-containing protein [Oscillospiraceae bacterium]
MIDTAGIERWITENLSEKRARHTFGCAEAARELALRFGYDAGTAYLAGLLHDITREQSLEEQLNLCRKYGIIPDEREASDRGLLHALTGSAVAGDVWGASEEIVHAIRVHTTGCVNMSKLDKIICLADYIEPGRHFKTVDELRELARVSLDRALLAALEGTIVHVIRDGAYLHPRTLEARNDLLLRLG